MLDFLLARTRKPVVPTCGSVEAKSRFVCSGARVGAGGCGGCDRASSYGISTKLSTRSVRRARGYVQTRLWEVCGSASLVKHICESRIS
jgi:hypothetical protein